MPSLLSNSSTSISAAPNSNVNISNADSNININSGGNSNVSINNLSLALTVLIPAIFKLLVSPAGKTSTMFKNVQLLAVRMVRKLVGKAKQLLERLHMGRTIKARQVGRSKVGRSVKRGCYKGMQGRA